MATRRRHINTTPDDVWRVLADGWLYPVFVVGAARMRSVDEGYPAVGTRLHHSAGVWPALISDTTEVLECEPGRRLKLRARGWPAGEAEVDITLEARDGGTEVSITEDAVSGPGRVIPKPARDISLALRNGETLRRLAYLAEGHAR